MKAAVMQRLHLPLRVENLPHPIPAAAVFESLRARTHQCMVLIAP